jgi:hypothetical protein
VSTVKDKVMLYLKFVHTPSLTINRSILTIVWVCSGAWGSVVVKALRY